MTTHDRARETYHHGNLREALIQAALTMIAERGLAGFAIVELARAVGVSPAAPYRHFRDRNAVVAEVARRGFEQLRGDLEAASAAARSSPAQALERCAQAHLAFAGRERAVYAAMFEASFPLNDYPDLVAMRAKAFAVVRRAAQAARDGGRAAHPPPALMMAVHVWSMTHGIAALFVGHHGDSRDLMPMSPEELLEAGLLVYLQALDLPPTPPA